MQIKSFSIYFLFMFVAIFFGYFMYLGFAPYSNQIALYSGTIVYILLLNLKATARRASYLLPYLWDVSFIFGTLYWLKETANFYGNLNDIFANGLLLIVSMLLALRTLVIAIIWNARAKFFSFLPVIILVVFYFTQDLSYKFDWLNLGYSKIDNISLVLAPIGGVNLVQFVKLCVATFAFAFVYHMIGIIFKPSYYQNTRVRYDVLGAKANLAFQSYFVDLLLLGLVSFVALLASFGIGYRQYTQPVGPQYTVALIQPNLKPFEKWSAKFIDSEIAQFQQDINNILLKYPTNVPKLVVMPESAIGTSYQSIKSVYNNFALSLVHNGSQLFSGVIYEEPMNNSGDALANSNQAANQLTSDLKTKNKDNSDTAPKFKFYNSAIMFTSPKVATPDADPNRVSIYNGIKLQRYDKKYLVPFGEFLPFASIIRNWDPFFTRLDEYGFQFGKPYQANVVSSIGKFAVGICFDGIYGRAIADEIHPDTGGILSISNDVWFGNSEGPFQHLNIIRFRALEVQKYILRDSNNGITAIINNQGEITNIIPRNVRATLFGQYQNYYGQTPFSQYTWLNLFLLIGYSLLSFIILGISYMRFKSKQRSSFSSYR